MADCLLSGFRALDLTDEKGYVCGKILASLGVDVIKVEKPGGDTARNTPPFYHNDPDPEQCLSWMSFNTDKRSITLDIQKPEGQDLFRKLVDKADFVIESSAPGYMESLGLGYEALSELNPRIIMTSITHFGQKGPHSQFKGSELVDSAMSGVLEDTGYSDRAPVKESLNSVYFHANVAAVLGTMVSHHHREVTGEGQQVDISIQEVATSRNYNPLVSWIFDQTLLKRFWGLGKRSSFASMRRIWECKDGFVFWMFAGGPLGAPANRALSQWMDEDGDFNPLRSVESWEALDMATMTQQTRDEFQTAISKFFVKHTKKEFAEEGIKRGINATVVNDVTDVLELKHLAEREFWVNLEYPQMGITLKHPKYFFLSNETENHVKLRAPSIGEHNEDIYTKELGLSASVLSALEKDAVI